MSEKSQPDSVVSASEVPAAPAPGAAEAPKTITLPETELNQLKAEAAKAAENWDRFLRAAAELENYRKRVQREKEELTRAVRETVIASLLPVMDNLERALEHSPNGTPLHDGLLQVQKQFERALAEFGLAEIVVKPGDPFNPNLHEAVSHVESAEHPDGAVIQQVQSGYKLGDRLLRAARVVVSKGPARKPEDATTSPNPAPASGKKNSWFKSPFSK